VYLGDHAMFHPRSIQPAAFRFTPLWMATVESLFFIGCFLLLEIGVEEPQDVVMAVSFGPSDVP